MPHLAGKKISAKHTTVITEAELLLSYLRRQKEVKKIVIGEIKSIKNGPRRLKITNIDNGLKLMIRGVSARQLVFVYNNDFNITDIVNKINDYWSRFVAN